MGYLSTQSLLLGMGRNIYSNMTKYHAKFGYKWIDTESFIYAVYKLTTWNIIYYIYEPLVSLPYTLKYNLSIFFFRLRHKKSRKEIKRLMERHPNILDFLSDGTHYTSMERHM